MNINQTVVQRFLDPELLNVSKVYETTSDGKLQVKFLSNSTFKFSQVKDIINLLSHLDSYTKFSQVDSIIKTSVEVGTNQVVFNMWVDDVNLDPFFNGNKEGHFYKEMLKIVKPFITI